MSIKKSRKEVLTFSYICMTRTRRKISRRQSHLRPGIGKRGMVMFGQGQKARN